MSAVAVELLVGAKLWQSANGCDAIRAQRSPSCCASGIPQGVSTAGHMCSSRAPFRLPTWQALQLVTRCLVILWAGASLVLSVRMSDLYGLNASAVCMDCAVLPALRAAALVAVAFVSNSTAVSTCLRSRCYHSMRCLRPNGQDSCSFCNLIVNGCLCVGVPKRGLMAGRLYHTRVLRCNLSAFGSTA